VASISCSFTLPEAVQKGVGSVHSSACSLHQSTSMNKRLSRTFIFLDRRLNAVPSPVYYERLLRGGRVKEIPFTKNNTSSEIGDKLLSFFPSLAGSDLRR